MNCREYRELIDDSLDTSLKGALEQRVRRHLDHCEACQEYYEHCRREHIALFTILNTAYADVHLPDGFADRVAAEMAAERIARRRTFLARVPRWALIAASLVAMVGFVFAAMVVMDVVLSEDFTDEAADGAVATAPSPSRDAGGIVATSMTSPQSAATSAALPDSSTPQLLNISTPKGESTMTKRKAAAAALTAAMAAAPLAAANGDEYQFIVSGYPAANYSYATSSSAITLHAGAVPVADISGDLEARSRSNGSSAAIMLNALPFRCFYMSIR